jgi:ABC-2 type transport system permease protein
MIRTIVRKEFRDTLRDGRFRVAGLVLLVLLITALGAGWMHHRDLHAQHEAASAAAREDWLSQGRKNPHSAAHYGVYVFKPQLPLSFVDRGLDPYTGVTVWLEAHRQNEFLYRPAQDGSAAQRLGNLTAATVLQVLVPLLIILLAFGAFAGEREAGTLRQVLALGVPPRKLAWGKAAGVAAALALTLVPAAAIGAMAITLASGAAPGAARVTLLGLAYLAYFAVFAAVTLIVSARARSSRHALLVLLAFWSVNTLIAPRVATDLSRTLYPTPSAFEFNRQMRFELEEGIDGHEPADQRRAQLQARLLAEHGVERVEDLPFNFAGYALQRGEEYGDRVFDRNYGALWQTFARQARVHEAAAIVAPLLAVRSISMGLAGTDFEQHRHFATAAEQYRRRLVKLMNDDLTYNARPGETYMADTELWAQVEPFEYEAPRAAWVLGNARLSIIILLLWLVGSVLVLARQQLRPE